MQTLGEGTGGRVMDEKLMFQKIRELCICCAVAVEQISRDCGIRQDLVAKMFVETFKRILERAEGE